MARAVAYTSGGRRTRCVLQLDTGTDWWWNKLCTVIVHEHGHFAGRGESSNPRSVMYPRYRRPFHDCRA
jgi:hypothetical protein